MMTFSMPAISKHVLGALSLGMSYCHEYTSLKTT